MAKIPFNIKYRPQIVSGEYKVENALGQPVRIICWNKKGNNQNIVGIRQVNNDSDFIETFDSNGHWSNIRTEQDLFIITPESELTEFDEAVKNICADCLSNIDNFPKFIKERSIELLDLARKEIEEELKKNLADNNIYRVPEWLHQVLVMAKENGKAEVLKDLPRWKKIRDNGCVDADGDTYTDCLCLLKHGWYQVVSSGTKVGGEIQYLPIRDLEKLPKED